MNRRGSDPEYKKALGRRLREAAQSAGLSSDAVAERLGVQGGSVRGWWVGRTEPSNERLEAYAAMVNQSVAELRGAEEETDDRLLRSLMEWIDLLHSGHSADEAYERRPGNIRPLTKEKRAILRAAQSGIEKDLAARGGADWNSLTEEQKLEILTQIQRQAEENRRKGRG